MLRAACSISLYSETYLILCILYLFSSHILESTQVRYTRHLTVPLGSDACCPVMIYISVSATRIGTITPELVFYFVAIVNATSLFGRWSAGVLADVIGTFLLLYFSFFYNLLSRSSQYYVTCNIHNWSHNLCLAIRSFNSSSRHH